MSLIHFCLDIWKSTLHQTAVEDISLCGLPWLLPGLLWFSRPEDILPGTSFPVLGSPMGCWTAAAGRGGGCGFESPATRPLLPGIGMGFLTGPGEVRGCCCCCCLNDPLGSMEEA